VEIALVAAIGAVVVLGIEVVLLRNEVSALRGEIKGLREPVTSKDGE